MAAIFPRWTNWIPLAIAGSVVLGLPTVTFAVWYWFSPEYTDVGYAPKQPIPFSHKLHAGELGLDCRYCHFTVEKSFMAAVPPTSTCMGCHTKVQTKSEKLSLLRTKFKTDQPIHWIRVHMLPDYVFFNHKAHVAAGVGCVSCHGQVDKMTVVRQEKPLSMSWCLDCHRNPNPHLRPRDQVTNMDWNPKDYKPDNFGDERNVFRKVREDISRLRVDLQNETPKKPVTFAGKISRATHEGKLVNQEINRIVVNPPEHCSGCHR